MQYRNHRIFFFKFTQSGGKTEIELKKRGYEEKTEKTGFYPHPFRFFSFFFFFFEILKH